MVAHAIAGSWLWNVRADPLRAPTSAIADSHEQCVARHAFTMAQAAARGLLGLEPDEGNLTDHAGADITSLLLHLLALSDTEVLSILAVVMAETLAVGSDVVEAVGVELATTPATYWQADAAFLTLLRQRDILQTLIGEVAGEEVAASNAHEKVKTLRGILGDCLTGTNGRAKAEQWVPRWLQFPARTYFARDDDGGITDEGDVASVANDDEVPCTTYLDHEEMAHG
jgi:ParB family chromosome partitioning protein